MTIFHTLPNREKPDMFLFRKSRSRTSCEEQEYQNYPAAFNHRVNLKKDEEDTILKNGSLLDASKTSKSLTVWRKSLLISCDGFTVIDSHGNLVFRVDTYAGRQRPREVILMDAAGKPVLTLRRHKKLRLIYSDQWQVYEGDQEETQYYRSAGTSSTKLLSSRKEPICCVRRQWRGVRRANSKLLACVSSGIGLRSRGRPGYMIEGSYADRSCKVLEGESREVVAEIRRKEAIVGGLGIGVSFGLEVFELVVQPGFDAGFAMALVLLLDQMFS